MMVFSGGRETVGVATMFDESTVKIQDYIWGGIRELISADRCKRLAPCKWVFVSKILVDRTIWSL